MAEYITIARPYAKAVYMIARESGVEALEAWNDFLTGLSFIVATPEAAEFLKRPEVKYEDKITFLTELSGTLLKRPLGSAEKNFIGMILASGRVAFMPAISEEFSTWVLADRNMLKAELISAYAVTDDEKNMFIKALKKRFNKDIQLSVSVDDSLISGAIVKAGDLVMDGSVRGRLEKIAHSLL